VVSIDPDNGNVRFRFPFGKRGPTATGANPLVIDGHVFVSASYGVGAVFAKIGKSDVKTVWANDDVMSSQYPTAVYRDGYLYGIDGRQDVGVAELRCIDPKTGKIMWTKDGFGMATLILADRKLVIMKTDGELCLAEPSPTSYRQLARARLFQSTARALPALADGLLYVRDQRTLKCLDLRP
jgi:outer membrane protein assembly factor BamB